MWRNKAESITDKDLSLFLIQKMEHCQMIKLNMSNLLGLGGGGVILHRFMMVGGINRECAIKLVPLRIEMNPTVMCTIRTDNIIRPKEEYAVTLKHPNIIKYLNHGYQIISGELHYFAGTENLLMSLY